MRSRLLGGALFLLVVLPAACHAQTEDTPPASAPPADSVQTPPPDTTNFRPAYKSTYDLSQSDVLWRQTLIVAGHVGRLTVSHSMTGDLGKGIALSHLQQTGRRRRALTSRTDLSYDVGHGVSLGAFFELPTTENRDLTYRNTTRNSNVSLTAAYKARPLSSLSVSLDAAGGRAVENYEQRQFTRSRDPDAPDRIDDSRGSGVSGRAKGSLTYTPRAWLSATSSYGYDTKRLESRSVVSDATGDSTTADSNNDHARDVSASLTVTPRQFHVLSLDVADRDAQLQYYTSEIHAYETKETIGRSGVLKWALNRDLDRTASVALTLGSSREGFLAGTGLPYRKGTAHVDVNALWRFGEAKIKFTFFSDSTRQEYEAPHLSGNIYTRNLSLYAERPFTRRLRATASGTVSLVRSVFDDTRNDQDLGTAQGLLTLSYVPSSKWVLNLTTSARSDEQVLIRSFASSNNTQRRVYTLSPSYSFALSKSTTVAQSFSITSDYTLYTFDESRNYYTGAWSSSATIGQILSSRARLDVAYQSQIRESGSYQLDSLTGIRLFGKSSENRNHDLTVAVTWQIRPSIQIRTSQRLNVVPHYTCTAIDCHADGEPTRNVELTGTSTLSTRLPGGATLSVTARRINSTLLRSHWEALAELNHTFFQ